LFSRRIDKNVRSKSNNPWRWRSVRWSTDWDVFEKYVRYRELNEKIEDVELWISSDGNHFNETWLQKIRADAADNYRIKVRDIWIDFIV